MWTSGNHALLSCKWKKMRKNTFETIDQGNVTLALLCRKSVTFEKETKTEKNLP